jgi:ABC-type sulfate transport system permease component
MIGRHEIRDLSFKEERHSCGKNYTDIVAIVFTPFLLITPITGIILLFRKTDLYGKETKEFLLSIRNWEIAANYVGIILAAGLIFIVSTGLIMFIRYCARGGKLF